MAEVATTPVITLAVVGDVHDQWEPEDQEALHHLAVDLVLFVGDLGNESLDIVRAIAALDLPKAVILGNHDAWYTATDWGRKKCPYDRTQEDRFQQQLDLLGEIHVGYSQLDFPQLGLSVVGARPFSWGGSDWKHADFYQTYYQVSNFAESTARIVAAAEQAQCNTLVMLGHCGPLGLGDRPEDPCGKDWQPLGGDHGDPDMTAALAQLRQAEKTIPLVAFGHMHHSLRHTKQLLRTPSVMQQGTLYLNAASVPRIIQENHVRRRNFSLVTLKHGTVQQASLVWLDQHFAISEQHVWYAQPATAGIPEQAIA